jgi:LmbE family N-acetylglucosaminyl deacetylase
MKLSQPESEIFIPDAKPAVEGLARCTHVGIAAHQDDLEIMAAQGILECFGHPGKAFLGVVSTNGSGSPRDGLYKHYTDAEMMKVRRHEQKKAALVGEYGALAMLHHPSAALKDPSNAGVPGDFAELLAGLAKPPQVLYTHNLADKHDTHVAVALRVLQACRRLPAERRPLKVVGCEVWRDLDWLVDADKVAMAVDSHENLQAALMGVFDSQIAGGKRYDLASAGRRRAHATYFESHGVDQNQALIWGMDLTPLVKDASLDPGAFVQAHIQRFQSDVAGRLQKLL